MSDRGRRQTGTNSTFAGVGSRGSDSRIRDVLSNASRPRRPSAIQSSLTF